MKAAGMLVLVDKSKTTLGIKLPDHHMLCESRSSFFSTKRSHESLECFFSTDKFLWIPRVQTNKTYSPGGMHTIDGGEGVGLLSGPLWVSDYRGGGRASSLVGGSGPPLTWCQGQEIGRNWGPKNRVWLKGQSVARETLQPSPVFIEPSTKQSQLGSEMNTR